MACAGAHGWPDALTGRARACVCVCVCVGPVLSLAVSPTSHAICPPPHTHTPQPHPPIPRTRPTHTRTRTRADTHICRLPAARPLEYTRAQTQPQTQPQPQPQPQPPTPTPTQSQTQTQTHTPQAHLPPAAGSHGPAETREASRRSRSESALYRANLAGGRDRLGLPVGVMPRPLAAEARAGQTWRAKGNGDPLRSKARARVCV